MADSLPQTVSRHPTLNAIVKYKNHPNLLALRRFFQRFSSSYFSYVDKNTFFKEIKKSNLNKAVQDSNIPL